MSQHAHASNFLRLFAATLLYTLLASCTIAPAEPTAAEQPIFESTVSTEAKAAIAQLLASNQRTQADRARDLTSKPDSVLAFFGVQPGMHVLDLYAGGGYYSELLNAAVGGNGRVYLHNNQAYLNFAGKPLDERRAAGGLKGAITEIVGEVGQLEIPPQSIDMVLMVMTYHDVYYKTEGWDLDPQTLFAQISWVLKPGGKLAIIDHVAAAGSGNSAAQTLHRIDTAYARGDIEKRGFKLIASSDVLRNPSDDYSLSVFDEAVRGKTDRFVYLFQAIN